MSRTVGMVFSEHLIQGGVVKVELSPQTFSRFVLDELTLHSGTVLVNILAVFSGGDVEVIFHSVDEARQFARQLGLPGEGLDDIDATLKGRETGA